MSGRRIWESAALPGCFVTSHMCSKGGARNLRTDLFEIKGGAYPPPFVINVAVEIVLK